MIHDETVTYEVAKLAQEKGFDWLECIDDCNPPVYTEQGTSSMHPPRKPMLKFSDQTVWVVAAETERVFDEFEHSYLPELWPTFGVYASEEDAERAAWGFYSGEHDRANENFEVEIEDCGSDFIKIRHTDKRYGGYAIYTLSWTKENIRTYE